MAIASPSAAADSPSAQDWPQYNADNRGWRLNSGETAISPATVGGLVEKWRFPPRGSSEKIGAVHSTPVVVSGFSYFGTAQDGTIYKLSPSGKLVWQFVAPRSKVKYERSSPAARDKVAGETGFDALRIVNSPLVTAAHVYFTTVDGQVFCLDRFTGQMTWTTNTRTAPFPEPNITNGFWSSPILAGDKLIVSGGAVDQGLPLVDKVFPGGSGRGFVVALAPQTGSLLWKYNIGPPPERFDPPLELDYGPSGKVKYLYGPSTSTVWSTPSYDEANQALYFGTDANNTPRRPTADDQRYHNKYSCAVIAVDASTGHEKWVRQLKENDVWNAAVPAWDAATGEYKDLSIGDTPKIYDVDLDGVRRQVVGVGCKDGAFYVIDRLTGELLSHTPRYTGPPDPERAADRNARVLALPSTLGGLQTGCAFDGGTAYTNGMDFLGSIKGSLESRFFLYPPAGGRVTAIRPHARAEVWRHERPKTSIPRLDRPGEELSSGDPVASGIAIANGVAFFTTTMSKKLVALRTADGAVLKEIPLEAVWCGPSVSRGRVWVGVGSFFMDFSKLSFVVGAKYSFPVDYSGAVYSFGLPGKDEVDQLPQTDTLVRH
jgi:outer membrane protein assembly factor BamB